LERRATFAVYLNRAHGVGANGRFQPVVSEWRPPHDLRPHEIDGHQFTRLNNRVQL